MAYEFNVQIKTKNFEVKVDTNAAYGYFEHDRLGDERGGGLWFTSQPGGALELIDCDGTAVLPREVWEALRENGFIVGEEFE